MDPISGMLFFMGFWTSAATSFVKVVYDAERVRPAEQRFEQVAAEVQNVVASCQKQEELCGQEEEQYLIDLQLIKIAKRIKELQNSSLTDVEEFITLVGQIDSHKNKEYARLASVVQSKQLLPLDEMDRMRIIRKIQEGLARVREQNQSVLSVCQKKQNDLLTLRLRLVALDNICVAQQKMRDVMESKRIKKC